jgi:hypothetical protein
MILLEDIIKRFLFENDEYPRPGTYNSLSAELKTKFETWLKSANLKMVVNKRSIPLTDGKAPSDIYDGNLLNAADIWWGTLTDEEKKSTAQRMDPEQIKRDKDLGLTPERRREIETANNFLPGSYNPETGSGKCKPGYIKQDPKDKRSPCVDEWTPYMLHVAEYWQYYLIGILLVAYSNKLFGIADRIGLSALMKGAGNLTLDGIYYLIGRRAASRLDKSEEAISKLFMETDDAIKLLIDKLQKSEKLTKKQKQLLPTLSKQMKNVMKMPTVRKEIATNFISYWKNQYLAGNISKEVLAKVLGTGFVKSKDFQYLLTIGRRNTATNPGWDKNAIRSVKELDKVGTGKHSDITDPKLRSYIDGVWM